MFGMDKVQRILQQKHNPNHIQQIFVYDRIRIAKGLMIEVMTIRSMDYLLFSSSNSLLVFLNNRWDHEYPLLWHFAAGI